MGLRLTVDINLKLLFDTLNPSFLVNVLSECIKDKTLIYLIKKFLSAEVVLLDGLVEAIPEGAL